jgi:formate/nitrite transporter FocA (FNT family)
MTTPLPVPASPSPASAAPWHASGAARCITNIASPQTLSLALRAEARVDAPVNTDDDPALALKEPSAQLAPNEVEQLAKRTAPRALVLHEAIRKEGEEELERSAWSLAWSGLAAGLSMGLSMLGMGLIQAGLPDAPWRNLVSSFGYTFGFLVVVLGRQQLFTENTVTAVLPLLHAPNRIKLVAVARLWLIVFLANIAGTLLFAAGSAYTGMFDDEARAAFRSLGVLGAGHDFGTTVAKAIVAGWVIALMVWVLPGAGPARF